MSGGERGKEDQPGERSLRGTIRRFAEALGDASKDIQPSQSPQPDNSIETTLRIVRGHQNGSKPPKRSS